MAVGVLELIRAQASGVAFSACPVTGKTDRVVIGTNWGWGEAVVTGLVTPDHVEVGKADGRTLCYRVAAKKVISAFDRAAGRVVETDMPARLVDHRVLDDEQVAAVVGAVLTVERYYGYPVDAEWVLDRYRRAGEPVCIVQARPVTLASAGRTLRPPRGTRPRWPRNTRLNADRRWRGFARDHGPEGNRTAADTTGRSAHPVFGLPNDTGFPHTGRGNDARPGRARSGCIPVHDRDGVSSADGIPLVPRQPNRVEAAEDRDTADRLEGRGPAGAMDGSDVREQPRASWPEGGPAFDLLESKLRGPPGCGLQRFAGRRFSSGWCETMFLRSCRWLPRRPGLCARRCWTCRGPPRR